jgi:hypothetical protein
MLKSGELQESTSETSNSTDARSWLAPDEEAGVFDVDPWTTVLDDWAEELEHPFPYPAGLP